MEDIVSYIIQFLIGGDDANVLSHRVGYTADRTLFPKYRVVIVPSPFFREGIYKTSRSMPSLPLNEIEGIPLLFGTPETEWDGTTLITHADIIAGSYFLITRYEEIIQRDKRDAHGRFPGKESLPYRAGFLHRPVVDEYGKLLRRWLRRAEVALDEEPAPHIPHIWLTHDIDVPFYGRSFRSLLRETVKGKGFRTAWENFTGSPEKDPYYTYPWLLDLGNELRSIVGETHCTSVFFFKAGGKSSFDRPHYRLQSDDMQGLLRLCRTGKASVGLHTSYDAGVKPGLIRSEKDTLETYTGQKITYNRHHYLASREPEDMEYLEKAGITDDFTLGYADVAGFRIGCSRPVHWINPSTQKISSLLLHPLTVMDCSLSEPCYMNLSYEEALDYTLLLIRQAAQVQGEPVLLWHNNRIADRTDLSSGWQRKLFYTLIEELKKI